MTNTNTNKALAIGTLIAGIGAFILAIAVSNGALDLHHSSEPVTLDVPVQPVDEPVNVESLDELVIVGSAEAAPSAHALGAALARRDARVSQRVSGPGAARRRPKVASEPLTVPGGTPRFASESALEYNPLSSHGVRSVHVRRERSTIGKPLRPLEREHETFEIHEGHWPTE
jgi:hypothetical protein